MTDFQLTDFLLFIGPWKCLAYGFGGGFLVGIGFSIWADEVERRCKSNPQEGDIGK